MQDRFKFRTWDKKRKIMVYCFEESTSKQIDKYERIYDLDEYYCCLEVGRLSCLYDIDDNFIVEQCTGLKDKNGNLIYEGDLIKEPANKYPLEIYYGKGAWQTREYRKNGNNEQLLYVLINCYGVEIIGNIHEYAEKEI